jgi:hypothetical protein
MVRFFFFKFELRHKPEPERQMMISWILLVEEDDYVTLVGFSQKLQSFGLHKFA